MGLSKNLAIIAIVSLVSVSFVEGADKPISCLACKDEKSCATPASKACARFDDECVTVFSEDKKLITLGCSSEVFEDNCVKNDKNVCYRCESDGCNNAKSDKEYIECHKCNSFYDPVCLKPTESTGSIKKCQKSCVTKMQPRDETYKKFDVVRGCFDDLDKDERDKCKDDKLCNECSKGKCNGGIFPADRLRCYTCKNVECQTPTKSEMCDPHVLDDMCMIRMDNKNVPIEYGCKSSLAPSEVENLQIDNQLFLCSGDNCNAKENLPKDNVCTACLSNEKRECITKIHDSELVSERCPSSPNTQCFSSFDAATGQVKRGCWSKIKDREARKQCLDKNDKNCVLCSGENCNVQTIPEDRKSCITCDSKTDPNCEEKPQANELCFKYNKINTCVTSFVNGETRRSCAAENDVCYGRDRYSCRLCEGDNCNNIDMKTLVKDTSNMGMWQDLPLTCKSCKTETACAAKNVTSEKCPNSLDECLTVFDEATDKVMFRGCSSALETTGQLRLWCDSRDDKGLCPTCKSNECNIAASKKEYVKCHYCGWPGTKPCNDVIAANDKTVSVRQCHKSCMIAAYQKHESDNKIFNIVRSCADDMEVAEQEKCKKDGKNKCRVCDNELCNSQLMYEDWPKCYKCKDGKGCATPKSELCDAYSKAHGCYYLYDSDKQPVQGNCMNSLSSQMRKDFLKNNKISFCVGSGCNKEQPKAQKCLKCDSKDKEDCATQPQNMNASLVECSVPNSKCYFSLTEEGTNKRGCMSELKEEIVNCLNTDTCKFCDGESCNAKIFPEGRQQCYICNSKEDKDCEKKPKSTKVCPMFRQAQKCVSKYTDKGETVRGCETQLTCDPKDKKKCEICDTADCNKKNLRELNSSAAVVANSLLIGFLVFLKVSVF